jgi:hypothetical protein
MGVRIQGHRGSWYATVHGSEQIPVLHNRHMDWKTRHYRDTKIEPEGVSPSPRWLQLIEDVKRLKQVVIQDEVVRGETVDGRPMTHRLGYVGLFFIENVDWDGTALSFDVVGRRK